MATEFEIIFKPNLIPAVIENFPYDTYLQKSLEYKKNYEEMIVTEKNLEECTKLKASTNKIVKEIDAERKRIKKFLTADITEFEEKCKTLVSCFQDVSDVLNVQLNKFEDNRRKEQMTMCQELAKSLLEKSELKDASYITNLNFPIEFTNKTTKLKEIETNLSTQIEKLIIEINLSKQQEANRKMLIDNLNLTYKEFGIEFAIENFPLDRFNDNQVKEFYECSYKKQLEISAAKKKKEDELLAAQELKKKEDDFDKNTNKMIETQKVQLEKSLSTLSMITSPLTFDNPKQYLLIIDANNAEHLQFVKKIKGYSKDKFKCYFEEILQGKN
jgi:hypothetical protein